MAVIDVTQHRHSVAFIVFVVLIDSVSFGIVLPVLPKLIVSLGDTDLSQASQTGGYLMFSAAVQFFAAPVPGISETAMAGVRSCCFLCWCFRSATC